MLGDVITTYTVCTRMQWPCVQTGTLMMTMMKTGITNKNSIVVSKMAVIILTTITEILISAVKRTIKTSTASASVIYR